MRVKCQHILASSCACEADIHGIFGSSDHINYKLCSFKIPHPKE